MIETYNALNNLINEIDEQIKAMKKDELLEKVNKLILWSN